MGTDDDLVLSATTLGAALELQSVRQELGRLRKVETQLRDAIMAELGDEERALTAAGGPPAVHIETQHRRNVDADKLEAMHPEVYAAVMKETIVRVLKVDLEGKP